MWSEGGKNFFVTYLEGVEKISGETEGRKNFGDSNETVPEPPPPPDNK